MAKDTEKNFQEEIHKEIQDFAKRLQEKYGLRGFSAKMATGQEVPIGRMSMDKELVNDKVDLKFNLTPREIKAELDRYVIKQESAKKYLANAAYYHYRHVERMLKGENKYEDYQKNNIIMVGNTGVGKTLLLKRLAKILGVPLVKGDATKFSKTGYVGNDVENLVRDLVREAGGNIRLAECGMIFVDEIDKIATDKSIIGRDITGTGVQTELLKPMEETEVELISTSDPLYMMQGFMRVGEGKRPAINTRNILFIVGGAFPGLADSVKKRLHRRQVGFKGELAFKGDEVNYLQQVTTEDFVEYGLLEEFVGRLPVRVVLDDLTQEDLYQILKHSQCAITRQYIHDFSLIDVKLELNDGALKRIAQLAHSEKIGARGLMTVCERLLADFKYELPGKGVDNIVITEDTIENPKKHLKQALVLKPLEAFVNQFYGATGIKLKFSQDATNLLAEKVSTEGLDTIRYCWEKLKGCDRLLEIIDLKEIEINAETLINPMREIATIVGKRKGK